MVLFGYKDIRDNVNMINELVKGKEVAKVCQEFGLVHSTASSI